MFVPDDALVAFCRHEHPRLVGTLSLYCGDADLAEELAQEVLCRCR
jgi:predicted RNA polymerase sigma factor